MTDYVKLWLFAPFLVLFLILMLPITILFHLVDWIEENV